MDKRSKRAEYLTLVELSGVKLELVQSVLEKAGEEITDGARVGAMVVIDEVNQALAELKKAF